MPSFAGSRANAFITKVENAKKTPAIVPQPSAVMSARMEIKLLNEIIEPASDPVGRYEAAASHSAKQLGEGCAGPDKERGEHERWLNRLASLTIVKASKTRPRGASKTRVVAISRSVGVVSFKFVSVAMFSVIEPKVTSQPCSAGIDSI
jgi:hypothetical protein